MRTVGRDAVKGLSAYAAAVGILLVWPDRPRAEPMLVFAVGGLVAVMVVAAFGVVPWGEIELTSGGRQP